MGRFVPLATWLPRYGKDWLRPDLLAGLTVWALLVPEAMAYAEIAGGLCRLGFPSVFMSKPVLTGFTFGLGLVIAVGQLPKLFGVEGRGGDFFEQLWSVIEELPGADLRTTAIGLSALAILLASRKIFGHKVPMALIVVFAAILLSNALDWEQKGVYVVGNIPASLPTLTFPNISGGQWLNLAGGALGIVLIAFAESYGTAKNFARRHGDAIDANQELLGLGVANVGAGLLGGFQRGRQPLAIIDAFHARVDELVGAADPPPHGVVLDLETVDVVDTDGGDELRAIHNELAAKQIDLVISRLNKQGRDSLRANDVYDDIGADRFFGSVQDAVNALAGEPPL